MEPDQTSIKYKRGQIMRALLEDIVHKLYKEDGIISVYLIEEFDVFKFTIQFDVDVMSKRQLQETVINYLYDDIDNSLVLKFVFDGSVGYVLIYDGKKSYL